MLSLSLVTNHAIIQSVLKKCSTTNIFVSLKEHMLGCEPMQNHVLLLIKAIAKKYLQVRYWYDGKRYTAWLRGQKDKNTQSW